MLVTDLGLLDYAAALELQLAAVEEVAAGGAERLFLVEHPPVVTLGRHGGAEHLLLPAEALRAQGVQVARAGRGGSVTCHFPGQLVAYPIVRLSGRPGGLRVFFAQVEQAVIDTLAAWGLRGGRVFGRPGVWVGQRKIASVGIGVRRWVSYHGLALNVGPDVSLFSRMTPCGLAGVEMTSVALELARQGQPAQADIQGVKRVLAGCLQEILD